MKKKKTIILSEKQLAEVCGNEAPSYFDDLLTGIDALNYGNEISADGSYDDGTHGNPTTGDDYADDIYSPLIYGIARTAIVGEMSKNEWDDLFLMKEGRDREHGNWRLKYRKFGAKQGEKGKTYSAAKQAVWRKKQAEKTAQTGATPEIKQKAIKSLKKMKDSGIDTIETQYTAAKNAIKALPRTIKSAPKESGNGKGHSKKLGDGYLTP